MTDAMIAVLGAGAMGSAFAARFAEAPGCTTVLVARGERGDRLAREGIVVNGVPYHLPVVHPEEAAAPADLILVALKHHHLPGAASDCEAPPPPTFWPYPAR